MFRDTPHQVLYTDAAFREYGDNNGFTLAQVPYHNSKKYLLPFALGEIPEWRSHYSKRWLRKNLTSSYSTVYAFVYSTDCLVYASWIASQKDIPLIIHLADHSDKFEQTAIFRILRNGTKLICITDDMRSKYESMLDRENIEVLHNGAENRCFHIPAPSPPPFDASNPFILCFLGGLFDHLHGNCIEDVFDAVSRLRQKQKRLVFHLFGQLQPRNFLSERLKKSGITHHGIVMPLEKKYEIMEKAHCFVIPSSFSPQKHDQYRYSFPTKLPELIASGRPILSYGPSDTATNRLLSSHNQGTRIHKRSVNELVHALIGIMDRYSDTKDEVNLPNERLIDDFSATKVRERLSEVLKV